MTFAKQGLYVLLARIFEFTVSMGSVILVARALGPEGRGKYALMTLIPMLLTLVTTFGITNANVYLLKQKKYGLNKFITNSIIFSFVSSALTTGLFYMLYNVVVYRFLPSLSPDEIFIPLLILPVSLLFFYLQNILLGVGAIRKYNLTNIMLSLSFFILLLLFMNDLKLTVWKAVYAWMFSNLFTCIVTLWFCLKESEGFRFSPDWSLAVESVRYGIKTHFGNVMLNSRSRLELIFIGYFMNNNAVGLYSIALGMIDKFDLLNRTISYLLFAEVSASNKLQGDKLTATVARNTFWVMIIAAVPLMLLSRPIIVLLYGEEFLLSRYPLCILLFSTAISALVFALGSLFQGSGKPQTYSLACGIGLVITAVLDLELVPSYGLVGAAVSNVLGCLAMCCFYLSLHLRSSDNRLRDLLLFKISDLQKYADVFKLKPKVKQQRFKCQDQKLVLKTVISQFCLITW